MALEQSMACWQSEKPPVRVVNWPEDAGEGGGLHLFSGPVRDLAPQLRDLPIECVLSVVPRPNQAFWTFSTLWSGWLWGRGAAAAFKSTLHRRRYDWNWHAAALYAALKNLSNHLSLNTPLFSIVPEPEPAFLSAVLLAGAAAGYDLGGVAIRTNHDPVELLWQRRAFSLSDREPPAFDDQQLSQSLISTLQERGEPSPYLHLHAAGLAAMAAQHSLHWMQDALPTINASFIRVLGDPQYIHHAHGKEVEAGLWGLADWSSAQELTF